MQEINIDAVNESASESSSIDVDQDKSKVDSFVGEQIDSKNIFDRIGDFFLRMVNGVFIFAILKLPRFIWRCITRVEHLRFLLKYMKSILRAVFWFVTWVAIVFAAWMAFGWEAFVRFWTAVGGLLLDFLMVIWNVIYGNFGVIWMVIALIGSAYGLVFVTSKKRRSRRIADEESSLSEGDK